MERFWGFWNSLSQGARDGIISTLIGGVILAIITLAFKLSGKSIGAIFRRLSSKTQNPDQISQPSQHELIIKVEQQQPAPQREEAKPVQPVSAVHVSLPNLPRAPVVGFVSRRDKDGGEILAQLKEELAPQKNQLVALWGDGGVGKTTIATEAARAMIEVFGGRIVWTSADGRPDFPFYNSASEFCQRFVAYFLQHGQSHSKTTKEDFDALETEKDNLLNAMDVAFEIQDWKSVMRIMKTIGRSVTGFLSLRGYWD